MDGERGITADDLPSIYREAYVNAVEAARHEHDPRDDWEGFVKYLWQSLAPALGLDPDPHDPSTRDADPQNQQALG